MNGFLNCYFLELEISVTSENVSSLKPKAYGSPQKF